jgi:hypothetical protein
MENEKDNFWLYIGGIIALAIVLVIMLKARETESVPYEAFSQTNAEVNKQIGSYKK